MARKYIGRFYSVWYSSFDTNDKKPYYGYHEREQEIIDGCTQNISEDEKVYVEKFLRNLMDISKEVQSK